MQIVEKMDEGPILAFGVHDLVGDETTPELTSRLIVLSDALLRDTLPQYMKGEKKPIPQEIIVELVKQHVEPLELSESYSRKLTKQDGILDFTKPAVQLEREIRAFTDWPKSRTTIAGKDVIITQSHVAQKEIQLPPGLPGHTYVTHEGILGIVTSKDTLLIDKLKPSGKSAMTAQAFLAGYGRNL